MASPTIADSLRQYEFGLRFADRDYYDRHLIFDHAVAMKQADQRQRFEALARSLRDLLTQRWLLTQLTHDQQNPKQVYYLSMEFLIGRTLSSTITNLGVDTFVSEDLRSDPLQDWTKILEAEPDAGLGNGGLGRLAACFLDSMATLQIPAYGYGLRYEYGMFRQEIKAGNQVEQPDNWLRRIRRQDDQHAAALVGVVSRLLRFRGVLRRRILRRRARQDCRRNADEGPLS